MLLMNAALHPLFVTHHVADDPTSHDRVASVKSLATQGNSLIARTLPPGTARGQPSK